jgi:hypothetical protein
MRDPRTLEWKNAPGPVGIRRAGILGREPQAAVFLGILSLEKHEMRSLLFT